MNRFEWRGRTAPRDVLARLSASGWAPGDAGARVVVVRTSKARLTDVPRNRPWIWVCDEALPIEAIHQAIDQGAVDTLSTTSPDWSVRLLRRLDECLIDEAAPPVPKGFVAESAAAKALLWKLAQAARTSMPVLLYGETGTGKELAARYIHQWSTRQSRTFVPINCAAIPNELMEGELFGYAKGAFSGAVRGYAGLVSAAEGGTVFLDEIDDTPHPLQTKLLRVLEDRVVSRLGENEWHQVDFRILAATNRDLRAMIHQGTFGEDLYERLSTFLIDLPPLRERQADLEPLVLEMIERYYVVEEKGSHRCRVRSATPEAIEVLRAYAWPGNVRELRNVIFSALVTKKSGEELLASDLPRRLWRRDSTSEIGVVSKAEIERRISAGTMNLRAEIERLERIALQTALHHAGSNASEAARLLGQVGRGSARDPGGTVRTMMKRLGVS